MILTASLFAAADWCCPSFSMIFIFLLVAMLILVKINEKPIMSYTKKRAARTFFEVLLQILSRR